MFETTPLADYRRMTLLRPCWYWVIQLDDKKRQSIAEEIFASFEAWMARQADEIGMVPNFEGLGALLAFGGEPKRIPLAEAQPRHCAPLLGCETALALKLWRDEDPAFARLTEKHGVHTVLSLVALLDDAPHEDALFQLNGVLVEHLTLELGRTTADATFYKKWADGFAQHLRARKDKKRAEFDERKKMGFDQRRKDMNAAKQLYRDEAVDYARRNPDAGKEEVLDHLTALDVRKTWGIEPRKRSVISQYIVGAIKEGKKRAKVQPRQDLYATRPRG